MLSGDLDYVNVGFMHVQGWVGGTCVLRSF